MRITRWFRYDGEKHRHHSTSEHERNCILPLQFYAIMKATYAGGKYSLAQSHIRSIDHTAPVDVVFACLPGGNCFGKPHFPFRLDLDFTHRFCDLPACSFAGTCSTSAPFVSPSSFCVRPFYGSLPGRRAIS